MLFIRKRRILIWYKTSLKRRLLYAFLVTSVIPIIISSFLSYYNSSKIVKENMDELTSINLQQTSDSLGIWLESYEDLLYQIYTDDDIIGQVDKLNAGVDVEVTVNQLRRTLRGLLNTKDYLRSITIFTENGTIVTYNPISAVSTQDVLLKNFSLSKDELYDEVSADNAMHVFGTEYAATFASEDYYLFHLAHRMINYKKLEQRYAIVVISIDEKLLEEVCQNKDDIKNYSIDNANFIVDDDGFIVAFPDEKQIGKQLGIKGTTADEITNIYKNFVDSTQIFDKKCNSVFVCHDDKLNWNIVNVSSRNEVIEKMQIQRNILTLSTLVSLGIVICIIIFLTEQLTGSIGKVVSAMEMAGKGDLSVRINTNAKMPIEVERIATQFNTTLGKLKAANEKEKEAGEKQKNAEIRALEAQINPHFLYNTLDTINWMAIDKDDFEISNAIASLANILRYAIDNSNGIVKVRNEVEWLKNYIFLQQTRLKNTFKCDIHVAPEIYEINIHKLLLQPFIENAILHGFEGVKRTHLLAIHMRQKDDSIEIIIHDNGKGIEAAVVEEINKGIFNNKNEKSHIGMKNAITRIHMYYGNAAEVLIHSVEGEGTEVIMKLPKEVEDK